MINRVELDNGQYSVLEAEKSQILPHAGWHEQDPEALVQCMVECINIAMEKLEWMGWAKTSVKGIGA
jgi:glycerol kinase